MSISRQRGAFSAIRRQKASAERRYACVFFLVWRKNLPRCRSAHSISGFLKMGLSILENDKLICKSRLRSFFM